MKLIRIFSFCFVLLLLISSCKTKEQEETEKEKIVELGKTIVFDYAIGFDNGTLFDTSFEDVAKQAGIYDLNRVYKPIRLVYAKDSFFPGLQEALLGMKE